MLIKTKTILLCATSMLSLLACQKNKIEKPTEQRVQSETVSSEKKAKNVILFIGDGMGVSTITAARIFDGQSKGMSGEDNKLSFEAFPNLAMVRTYNLDAQVPDSAGTASAINTGKRTQIGKINVQPDGLYAGCKNSTSTPPILFADLIEKTGMSTGIVTTTRITHATPAAVYGHAKSRGWEVDSYINKEGLAKGCVDLATQLVNYGGQNGLEIALGGGLVNFIPKSKGGKRKDGVDLTEAWAEKSNNNIVVSNKTELENLDPKAKQNVLGLFSKSHLAYEADRAKTNQPSLSEMTKFAIENLQARNTGYFLMVEAGRIDHAHHSTNAYRALTDTQALAKAVALADELTNDDDTLILVTADHSHVFTIAGYPKAGNPILGLVYPPEGDDDADNHGPATDADGLPYTTLGYHNGPNIRTKEKQTDAQVQDKNYRQQAAIRRASETHGGEDVMLFAKGAGANQVSGVIDQYQIFDIMRNAAGLDKK